MSLNWRARVLQATDAESKLPNHRSGARLCRQILISAFYSQGQVLAGRDNVTEELDPRVLSIRHLNHNLPKSFDDFLVEPH